MFKKAERKRVKLRLAIEGPSGSGKTHSAIVIARGLVGPSGKIAMVDTENESASLYAHLTDFDTAAMSAPYEPERFIKAIRGAEQAGYDCLIIDSISHEWSGKGGCLEIHGAMQGNSFVNWGKVTPRHDAFIQALLHSPMHIIATMRSKETYTLAEDSRGKQKPEKAGEAPLQRQGVSYEFTTVLSMNTKHVAESTKDRTGLFPADYTFTPSEQTGADLLAWLNSGKDAPPPEAPTQSAAPASKPVAPMDMFRREFPAAQTMERVKELFAMRSAYTFTPEDGDEFLCLKDAAKGRLEFVGESPPASSIPDADQPATAAQIKALQTHYSGYPREDRLAAVGTIIGRTLPSFSALSKAEAHVALETINQKAA